nr:hypothetical protein OG409_24780 [Streptomyces sp. NBC_00974]
MGDTAARTLGHSSGERLLFLTEDGSALVACIGGQRPDGRPPQQVFDQRGQTSP